MSSSKSFRKGFTLEYLRHAPKKVHARFGHHKWKMQRGSCATTHTSPNNNWALGQVGSQTKGHVEILRCPPSCLLTRGRFTTFELLQHLQANLSASPAQYLLCWVKVNQEPGSYHGYQLPCNLGSLGQIKFLQKEMRRAACECSCPW